MDNNLKFRLKDYHKKLDRYTKTFLFLMGKSATSWNAYAPTAADFVPPVPETVRMRTIDIGQEIPNTAERESIFAKLLRWYLNSGLQPFSDLEYKFNDVRDGIAFREEYFDIPTPNVIYKELSSDEMTSRLAYTGMSCHYMRRAEKEVTLPRPENTAFIHDVSALGDFAVRAPFERYGAAAYFDKDHAVCGIYCCYSKKLHRPGEGEDWEYAKWVWRTTFFLTVTFYDHLLISHLTESSTLFTATRKHLRCAHPLRIFLEPFIFHTDQVNSNAAFSLTNKRGLVNRIWAFDFDEIVRLTEILKGAYKFRTLPDFVHPSMRDMEDEIFPMQHDALGFWKVMRNFTEGFVKVHFPTDADLFLDLGISHFCEELCKRLKLEPIKSRDRFIDVLTQLICNGSGIHEHVGQVSDYMMQPDFLGCKLQKGEKIINLQTYAQVLGLTVMTGLEMPRLESNWGHLFSSLNNYQATMDCYNTFRKELSELRQEIVHRNEHTRRYPFESFNPENLECSVSV